MLIRSRGAAYGARAMPRHFSDLSPPGKDPVVHADATPRVPVEALACLAAAWIAGSKSGNDEEGKERERNNRKRNADRRKALMPCHYGHGRASISGRRTSVGVPPRLSPEGLFIPKAQRQARLPGTRQERLVLNARPNRGAKTLRGYCGRYPPLPVPVQRCTSRPSRSAGRDDAQRRPGAGCKAAHRTRPTIRPAGRTMSDSRAG